MDLTSPTKSDDNIKLPFNSRNTENNEDIPNSNDANGNILDLKTVNNERGSSHYIIQDLGYEESNVLANRQHLFSLNLNKEKETTKLVSDNKNDESIVSLHETITNISLVESDDDEEFYMSEYEDNDSESFTKHRKNWKHSLNRDLKQIDSLDTRKKEEIVVQFNKFMEIKSDSNNSKGDYSGQRKKTTPAMYSSSLKNCILPAFYRLCIPFRSEWIIDCTTAKNCTFDGIRRNINETEPIYVTSRVMEEALEICKELYGETGSQSVTLLSALINFMNFIELHFTQRLNCFGNDILNKISQYHNRVRTYIKATNTWKKCNYATEKAHTKNKIRKEYENPNQSREVLTHIKKYMTSEERLNKITKLSHIAESEIIPSSSEIVELAKIVMGEIVASTGCRPVAVRHLPVSAYIDKKEGFNPGDFTDNDCIEVETYGGDSIYRRVDPNLPPEHRACEHQIRANLVHCPVTCEDRCEPDGYNILVTWDKTQDSKSDSYLHIAKPIKDMMDMYDLVRSRYFKGRISPVTSMVDWLDDDDTTFFLNSACSTFQSLDLSHISKSIGVDITSYAFRRIVSTWAQSHKLAEIREAEEQALQHSNKVAKDRYLQNPQVKPQRLTQKYVQEENLFPDRILKEIETTEQKNRELILETEKKRTNKRLKTLKSEWKQKKLLQEENRPLGPKQRILTTDTKQFMKVLEESSGLGIESFIEMKPLKWRHAIVRHVCSAVGLNGQLLRNLWRKIYKGDLHYGVRDMRLKAKKEGWKKKGNYSKYKDRNSWIAFTLRNSCLWFLKKY